MWCGLHLPLISFLGDAIRRWKSRKIHAVEGSETTDITVTIILRRAEIGMKL